MKEWPAAIARALRVASSTSSSSLPARRTSRGPEDSQKANPKRRWGEAPHQSLVQILHGLDEVGLAEDEVQLLGLVDPDQEKLQRDVLASGTSLVATPTTGPSAARRVRVAH